MELQELSFLPEPVFWREMPVLIIFLLLAVMGANHYVCIGRFLMMNIDMIDMDEGYAPLERPTYRTVRK